MLLKYFDIHSHIQFPQFSADKDAVLQRMEDEGVWAFVVGTDAESSALAVREVAGHKNLFATVGLHPNDVFKETFDISAYRGWAQNEKVAAIGECGLDYFRTKNQELRIRQKEILEQHIALAVEVNKPLMIHCRDAHDDLIDMLKSKKRECGEKLRGNIHFFTGSKEIAQKYFDLDFTISFTGVVTFTHEYDDVVRYAPLTHIMSETDCPFAAPVPYRGGRNEPAFVTEVVKKIAEIRKEDAEKVRDTLVQNVRRQFSI